MKSVKPKPYNWGANYTRLDCDVQVIPPLHKLLLCVRVVQRVTGYQCGKEFLPFVEYSRRKALGGNTESPMPVHKTKLIFHLDMWGGDRAPWQHAHTGYCGFYQMPQVSPEYWHSGNNFALDSLHIVYISKPSLMETQGYDQVLPGWHLAQSYMAADGFKNWAIHNPGYRWRSTGEFCIPPTWSRVPDINVDYWLPLPDLSCPLSFR